MKEKIERGGKGRKGKMGKESSFLLVFQRSNRVSSTIKKRVGLRSKR